MSSRRKRKSSKNVKSDKVVKNRQIKDNSSRMIFKDPVLCAEFLRGYVGIDLLKEVRPEDIEDISERFLPMWQESRESDVVKRVKLKDTSLFLIAIVEHQSKVHYDMAFRMLRYIVMVLTDYEREQEKLHKGITKTKDFKYPPILPIIYYEGSEQWTAVRNFKDRVYLSDVLSPYIPDFQYLVVPLHTYTNQELLEKKDELSLVMLINKFRDASDFEQLKEIPPEYFEDLSHNTPEYLLKLLGQIISVLLYRMNIPREEVENFTDQIERREFDMLFDSFQAYDVQAMRKKLRKELREELVPELREELTSEFQEKYWYSVVERVCKKIKKGINVQETAELLEEDAELVQRIYDAAAAFAPVYDTEKIVNVMKEKEIALCAIAACERTAKQ